MALTSNVTQKSTGSILKAYGWLSSILVVFLGSYITGVLTAVIPPPKELLCKLSLGFCPTPNTIVFSAVDIDRIVDHSGVGQGPGINQIGMLHNAVEPNIRRPNMVRYRISVDAAGKYSLRVLYASAEERPVSISVNDTQVTTDALRKTTGGWNNEHRAWSQPQDITLSAGDNTLLLRRGDVFPHLSKFELREIR